MKIACISFTQKGGKEIGGEKLVKSSSEDYIIHHFSNDEIDGGIKSILLFFSHGIRWISIYISYRDCC